MSLFSEKIFEIAVDYIQDIEYETQLYSNKTEAK
jgi:hypothetical protein